jgi:cell division protein FtsL
MNKNKMMMIMMMAMMIIMVMIMILMEGTQFNIHRSYETLVWSITCSETQRDSKPTFAQKILNDIYFMPT